MTCVLGLLAPSAGASVRAHSSVVGGSAVAQGAWPWMAFVADVQGDQAELCSGTVIAPNVVLTAAHCAVDDQNLADYHVITSSADWSDQTTRVESTVSAIDVYPGYDARRHFGDAALLVLAKPVAATPIALAQPSDVSLFMAGTAALVGGWGETSANDPNLQTRLLSGATTVQKATYCAAKAAQSLAPFNASSQLCTIDPTAFATGACQGDSGGPLIASNGGIPVEIGITSWGDEKCDTQYPSFFTRTDYIASWVSGIVTAAASQVPAQATSQPAAPSAPVSTPPALGTLKLIDVPSKLRQAITQRMGNRFRGATHYRRSCARRSHTSVRCAVVWDKGGSRYSGVVVLSLKLDATHSQVVWDATFRFSGRRLACVARRASGCRVAIYS
jgi:trypsin